MHALNTLNMSKQSDITLRAISRNLSTMTPEEQSHLHRGLNLIPVHKVLQHLQYLQNTILPAVEKRNGGASTEYQHFKGITDALVWAINTNGYHDRLMMELSNERLLCEFYRDKCLFYQNELMRYTTREDLAYEETFKATSRAMVGRATVPDEDSISDDSISDQDLIPL